MEINPLLAVVLTLSNMISNLYSNFTFFLVDPINGDQIRQKEDRNTFGLSNEYNRYFYADDFTGKWTIGSALRRDFVSNVELSRTLNRETILESLQFGDVDETNLSAFVIGEINFDKITLNGSVRFDYFDFRYRDLLLTTDQKQSVDKSIVSPSLNLVYNYRDNFQIYAKAGKGFHTNDTRVIIQGNVSEIIPAAYGFDLGYIWKPVKNVVLNTAFGIYFSNKNLCMLAMQESLSQVVGRVDKVLI